MRAFELHQVSAGYGDRTVLNAITCAVEAGCTTALVGPGASGKTTLLRLLCDPDGGGPPGLWSTGTLSRAPTPVAVLPQKERAPRATFEAEIAGRLGAHIDPGRWLADVWRDVADDAAAALAQVVDAAMGHLPTEVRRLAEFSLAVGGPEAVQLLDEPELGAGPREREWILAKLRALRGHKTILLVTHNLRFADEASDDLIFLLDGDIVESGATRRVFTAPRCARTRDFITMGG